MPVYASKKHSTERAKAYVVACLRNMNTKRFYVAVLYYMKSFWKQDHRLFMNIYQLFTQ